MSVTGSTFNLVDVSACLSISTWCLSVRNLTLFNKISTEGRTIILKKKEEKKKIKNRGKDNTQIEKTDRQTKRKECLG